MIRISDQVASLTAALSLARARFEADRRQLEATTGLRVNAPSDDPSSAATAGRADADQAAVTQCAENINLGRAELAAADAALQQVNELMIQAREIAVTMANGHIGADERAAAALVVQQLRREAIALANTSHNGYYIFGGFETGATPFSSTGTYSGDTNTRSIWATPDLKLEASISGAEAFTSAGGTDVFAVLDSLATALSANSLSGIQQGLTDTDAAQRQVLAAATKAGMLGSRMIELDSMLDGRSLDLTRHRASVADADVVETLSELARAQQAINTSVQVSARVLATLTLVDKL